MDVDLLYNEYLKNNNVAFNDHSHNLYNDTSMNEFSTINHLDNSTIKYSLAEDR